VSFPLSIEFEKDMSIGAKMKVIGIGGGGGNAIDRMIQSGLTGVEFIIMNTDGQAVERSLAAIKLQLGRELTKGRGVGGNPELGRQAAEENEAEITELLRGSELVFIAAGMGGGTGTGAAPVVAKIARDLGALTIAVVTKPFHFEGNRRMMACEAGIKLLREQVDALIVIPNQRILNVVDATTTFPDALKKADSVLTNATRGISDIISLPGLFNVDLSDVRSVMQNSGDAIMGIGIASGPDRAKQIVQMAIHSPLLEDVQITGASGLLVNITGSPATTFLEVMDAMTELTAAVGSDVNVKFGAVFSENAGDELKMTVIATGFKGSSVDSRIIVDQSVNFQPQRVQDMSIAPSIRREIEAKRTSEVTPVKPNGNGNGSTNGNAFPTTTSLGYPAENGNGNGNPNVPSYPNGNAAGYPNGNGYAKNELTPNSAVPQDKRIRLVVDLDGEPPPDFAVPTIVRRNGNHVHEVA
jgi:cell division protein FtsZ